MAVEIYSPPYSFIQVNKLQRNYHDYAYPCGTKLNRCLPIYDEDDLVFQFFVSATGDDYNRLKLGDVANGGAIYFTTTLIVSPPDDPINDCEDIASGFPSSCSNARIMLTQLKVVKAEDNLPYQFIGIARFNPAQFFQMPAPGVCFRLVGIYAINDDTLNTNGNYCNTAKRVGYCSNCLVMISDPCDTSRFSFRCKENSFGYIYKIDNWDADANEDNLVVRLPCYMRDMQLPSEEKSYRKSNGSRIKLFERIDEDYELKIDFISKQLHQRLKILLGHDIIFINNPNETQGVTDFQIVCQERYEISWPDIKYGLAPAKTRIMRAEALSLSNSNCR